MKITEQTMRELLVNPHTIAELIAPKSVAKLYEGVKPYDEAEVKSSTVAAEVMLHQANLSHQASTSLKASPPSPDVDWSGRDVYDETGQLIRKADPTPSPEASAFHLHVEHCGQCQKHWKALCDEGKRLLQEWAVSYVDARVN